MLEIPTRLAHGHTHAFERVDGLRSGQGGLRRRIGGLLIGTQSPTHNTELHQSHRKLQYRSASNHHNKGTFKALEPREPPILRRWLLWTGSGVLGLMGTFWAWGRAVERGQWWLGYSVFFCAILSHLAFFVLFLILTRYEWTWDWWL